MEIAPIAAIYNKLFTTIFDISQFSTDMAKTEVQFLLARLKEFEQRLAECESNL